MIQCLLPVFSVDITNLTLYLPLLLKTSITTGNVISESVDEMLSDNENKPKSTQEFLSSIAND